MKANGSNPAPRTKQRRPFIEWGRKLGLPECPYLIRWLVDFRLFSIRIHHWVSHDDKRNYHDHPWDFLTVCLKGGYTDVSYSKWDTLSAGSFRIRKAEHQHFVHVHPGGAWTLLLTGPQKRKWGFWVNGKFRKANKYFLTIGHHPCN